MKKAFDLLKFPYHHQYTGVLARVLAGRHRGVIKAVLEITVSPDQILSMSSKFHIIIRLAVQTSNQHILTSFLEVTSIKVG